MSTSKPTIICLMGPTAAGKTDIAVELVKQLPCNIISVDSAMIYRGMDIGTAKPDPSILKIAPHRLIDILDPTESYSAAQFCADANKEIDDIIAQGRIPLLVGGTMLYFRSLQQGLSELPSANKEVRAQLLEQANKLGWQAMHAKLSQVDPVAAARIHPNDPQRLLRALEVYEVTGKPITVLFEQSERSSLVYNLVNLAVAPDRQILHHRIELRFKKMLAQGLLEEVDRLFQRGDLSPNMPAIRAVGYRQVWEYLSGKINYEQLQEQGIIATRQLAKRQLTWLRAWKQLQWFDSESPAVMTEILIYLTRILSNG